jgi:hypothetical protein
VITVERFIAGKVCGCETLFDRGRPLCWSPFYKYRCYPEFGPSAVRMWYSHPKLRDIVEKLGAMTQFHGFCTFCFIHDEMRDELVLLELNFRPGTGMHFRGRIRKMFASGVAVLIGGTKASGGETHGLHGKLISLFPQDLNRAIAQKNFWYIVRLIVLAGIVPDFPFDDLPLLACHLREWADRLPPSLRSAARIGKAALGRVLRRPIATP